MFYLLEQIGTHDHAGIYQNTVEPGNSRYKMLLHSLKCFKVNIFYELGQSKARWY